MEYAVIGAIALAIIGYLVYTIKSGAAAEATLENEKATLREEREMAGERINTMESTALKTEYELRDREDREVPKPDPNHPRSSVPFLRKKGDGPGPDDLN